MGRPKKLPADSALGSLHIRLRKEDTEKIDYLCKKYALTKTQLIQKLLFSAK